MISNRVRGLAAIGSLAIVLTACGSGNNSSAPAPTPVITPPPTPVDNPASKFGSCFATRFAADPNTKATDPVPCPDLPPLTLTAKPTAF